MGLRNVPAKKIRKLCNKISELMNQTNLTNESVEALRNWFLGMATACEKELVSRKAAEIVSEGKKDEI